MDKTHKFFKDRRALLGYVFIVLVCAWGVAKSYQNSEQISKESIQRDYDSCNTSNDGRQALKDVIQLATEAGQTPDLTKMPSYANLTPSGQQFVRELNEVFREANESNDNRGLQVFSDTRLILRDCEAILREK